MKLEICTVGGFSEVGKNMTAIKYGNEVVICDMGLHLPKIISFEEETPDMKRNEISKETLIDADAIPNDHFIEDWKLLTKAIVLGHCHLDHIGAVPYLAEDYDCPIIGTPYTIEILKSILRDEKIKIKNPLKTLNANAKLKVSENITIEFINITHSTLQCVLVAIHTPKGIIIYANDYKFDNNPTLGKKPNYARLKELGKTGKVIALIINALYAEVQQKTPSENVAREMLKDVLLGTENKGHAIIVTTFASHIARLKSVIEFGLKLKRKVILLGRSMYKYVMAAERLNLIDFSSQVEIVKTGKAARRRLSEISKHRDQYLIVCTGNQGEPNAILTRMVMKELDFKFKSKDHVIFSSHTIPDPINIVNRALVEERLLKQGVRIFKDIHVSGHGAREDHRDLIEMLNPKHIFPSHAGIDQLMHLAKLAVEIGYVLGKTVHIMHDGQMIDIE
ncbi:MAG: RNase J family beta-CASP ribonuclease [Nanoarchaeota archaeon]|nr:RNase J family beta-CASP ribonuclease [Nanoarchaeota archaeon]MBU4351540.1 RNase J family beta-CASP ribonuclease [Nanoarchaeota archaeon]MBU4456907.1 RNase J family beta-CASP ribonuclease [Nanoarchaeota archaeon]MCG2720077.1 RNase J family beta-CASP ribonuclease [Nanoarchaeota archaeon]